MSPRDDGGPAYPVVNISYTGSFNGMSLRDHFAGLAMQGYIASMSPGIEPAEHRSTVAADCYMIADAMLAERAKAGG